MHVVTCHAIIKQLIKGKLSVTSLSVDKQITFIYTNDLARSATFYEGILSLELWRDQKSCRIYQVTDTAYLGVCQVGEGAKGQFQAGPQTNIILTIVTSEVDRWYERLVERGLTIDSPPRSNDRYHIYHFFFRDPNGYLIEVQQFLD